MMNEVQRSAASGHRQQTMQALVLHAPGCLSLEETPIPALSAGDLLIKVVAATTCGTDLKAYLRGHPQIPMPGLLGHEYAGIVVDAGDGAKFNIGDELMGVHSAPCQKCQACLGGDENLCDFIMQTKVLGSYAEYLRIPAHIANLNVFHKPKDLAWSRASLLEPLACVAHGLSKLKTRVTDRVLVIGPGAIGLMFVAALRALGLADITLLGRNQERLAVGEKMGSRAMSEDEIALDVGRGYDVVIECTGKVDVWEKSINWVRRGGQVMLFGGCPSGTTASFDTHRLHYDQITLLSPFHFGTRAVLQAREWLLDPSLPFDLLISGHRKLDEAVEVLELLKRGIGLKYVFQP